jgi:hypothetical protein
LSLACISSESFNDRLINNDSNDALVSTDI